MRSASHSRRHCDVALGRLQPTAQMRRRLLLLPCGDLALGLLCSLLRRRFRLRFGLLHHTALLAMRDGKFRNGAVANRHALHSDYYSTTKKTATPLNEWWTTAPLPTPSGRACLRSADARRAAARSPASKHATASRIQEIRMAQRFPRYQQGSHHALAASAGVRGSARTQRCRASLAGPGARKKNYAKLVAGCRARKNSDLTPRIPWR